MKAVSNKYFFNFLFKELEGYLALATIDRAAREPKFRNHYFRYPDDLEQALTFIEKSKTRYDVYFAPFLTTEERRKKESIAETVCAWADGDDCPIEALQMQPSAVIVTSEGRHAFFWKFNEIQPPEVGEAISKRIAYFHADEGMDKSGWDLSQVLRVPGTLNHKYAPPQKVSPAFVDPGMKYDTDDFSEYPEDIDSLPTVDAKALDTIELPKETAEHIMERFTELNPRAYDLFSQPPITDWSRQLWELEITCFEAGMSPEEVFVVASASSCNKYRRDKRKPEFLWKEVNRAYVHFTENREAPPPIDDEERKFFDLPDLLKPEEVQQVENDRTFIEMYVEWAKAQGDAAAQYHPVCAMSILSSLLAGSIRLPTSFGTLIPNLWFMILADTTLTRKSTAMDMAVELLAEVDLDVLLATDGSVEGILTAMSTRPNRSSLFFRDEIAGFVEQLSKKDYLAGMMETLTKLYDGKPMKRVLRSETIQVTDPILVTLSGGILSKMIDILDDKHVTSGFLPRFIFVTAESDLTKLKPVGPPTEVGVSERTYLLNYLHTLHKQYVVPNATADGTRVHLPKNWIAELTLEAWDLYNRMEMKMVEQAVFSLDPAMMTPAMDRLAKSGLKMAVLIAASRMESEHNVTVKEIDVLHAFYYIQKWQQHTLFLLNSMGGTGDERKLKAIFQYVRDNPGVGRSKVMQRFRLTARETDNLFMTMEQRRMIKREKRGSLGERLRPL